MLLIIKRSGLGMGSFQFERQLSLLLIGWLWAYYIIIGVSVYSSTHYFCQYFLLLAADTVYQ